MSSNLSIMPNFVFVSSDLLSLKLNGSTPVLVPGQVRLLLLPLVLVLHILLELMWREGWVCWKRWVLEVTRWVLELVRWVLELTWTREATWMLLSLLLASSWVVLVALRPTPLFFIIIT